MKALSSVLAIGACAALFLATCNQSAADPVVEPDHAVGLLALDLAPAAADLRDGERLPTTVTILVDGAVAGEVLLPAPDGLLAGHATIPVAADVPVELAVRATFADGETAESETVDVEVAADHVVTLPLIRAEGARLILGQQAHLRLPAGTQLAVYFTDRLRPAAVLDRLSSAPAAAINAVLIDPTVDAVVPFGEAPSSADEVGSLVGAGVAAQVVEDEDEPESPAPTRASDAIYYYSYCSCAKPVADHAYTATLADGSTISGKTDRFGLVLLADVGGVESVYFGAGQQERERNYVFDPAKPDNPALFASLVSEIANDRLTALLDLRKAPLEDARSVLVQLLDHEAEWTRVNAAVTLSYYADLDGLVAERLALMEGGEVEENLVILGALRHPAARGAIEELLGSDDYGELAAWAAGFLAEPQVGVGAEPAPFIYFQF